MKKNKLILAMMLISFLSGCGASSNKASAQDTKEIVRLEVWGGENEKELLSEMVSTFAAEYEDEAIFEVTIDTVNEGDCKNKILSDVNATADIFTFSDDHLIELAAAGVLGVIKDDTRVREANSEGSVEAASINDKMYAYPMTSDNGYFLFYNNEYFSDEDVKSLNKMIDIAGKAGKKVSMDWSAWYLYSFFGNTGLKIGLNEDSITNYCDWNSTTGAIKGIDVGKSLIDIANSPGFIYTADKGFVAGAQAGDIVAGVSGIWLAVALENAWGDNLAAVKLPTYTCAGQEVQMASYAGYKLMGVNDYSKEKEWAAKLAEWFTNEENQKLRFEKRGLGPSNKNAIQMEEVQKSKTIQALLDQAQYSSVQRVGVRYWETVDEFGRSVAQKEITYSNIQSAMDEMVKAITKPVVE